MKVSTASEMYESTLEGVNKYHNGSIAPNEWEILINESMMAVVKNYYIGVESVQKRIDDLSSLVREIVLIPTGTNLFDFENPAVSAGGAVSNRQPAVDGRYGYLFMLNSAVLLNYKGNECIEDGVPGDAYLDSAKTIINPVRWIMMKPMKADKRWAVTKDKYNRPTDERPYWWFFSTPGKEKTLQVITDTQSTAHRVLMQYLEHPRTILLANNTPADIDLNMHVREEVVRHAIKTYLERIESRRTNTVQQIENQNIT